ncbi:MAG: GNAT family N-acetyltransferase [Dehalococcoidia bacterium]
MRHALTEESLDGAASAWHEWRRSLRWGSVFVLPAWLGAWWEVFGGDAELYLRSLRDGSTIVGFAPLAVNGETACFVGDADVCDYMDFVVAPGHEGGFFETLLDDLRADGIERLDLGPVRPDSTVRTHLETIARSRGHKVLVRHKDVSLELDLPDTWDEYLSLLKNRQRHEIRRKLRRLHEAGEVDHRCAGVGPELPDYLDEFLQLFSLSRDDKARFMTPKMVSFFRALARSMAEIGLLRFGILELDGVTAAMTMGFDYDNRHYLYNSAYAPRFDQLSVGLLCKVLCIKESIEKGVWEWSFLKGSEPYKYQLGGREVPLYRCRVDMV